MSEIREDQNVKLALKTEGNLKKELDCQIKSIEKDRLSLIFQKESVGDLRYLEEGEEYSIKVFTPSGLRMFDAVVLDLPFDNEVVIEYVEDNIHVQRREYTRIFLETKVIIDRIDKESIVTHTLDISGGAIRIYYEGTFEPDELVTCRLYLPFQLSSINAQGRILFNEHLKKNEHVINFTSIRESERDKIIKKCFEIEIASYKVG